MKKLLENVLAFFKKLLPKPPPVPRPTDDCVHCGRPFEQKDVPGGEPIIECRHENGTTEYVLRYPNTWRVKIVRQKASGERPSCSYLGLCEFCFLMKPRFIGFNFERSGVPHYVWATERGQRYDRYDYGKGPIFNE